MSNFGNSYFSARAKEEGWHRLKVQTALCEAVNTGGAVYMKKKGCGEEAKQAVRSVVSDLTPLIRSTVKANDLSVRPMERDRHITIPVRNKYALHLHLYLPGSLVPL